MAHPVFAGQAVPRLVVELDLGRGLLRVAEMRLSRLGVADFAIFTSAQPGA
jgi:hypothetical protein